MNESNPSWRSVKNTTGVDLVNNGTNYGRQRRNDVTMPQDGESVRGYGYQQLGPKDQDGDPVGGRGLAEFGIETRIRLRQFGGKPRVINIDIEIGEDRPLWLNPLDPAQCCIHIGVCRVLAIPQSVQNPGVDSFKCCERHRIQIADIAGIGKAAETVAERPHRPVPLPERQHRQRAVLAHNLK